MKIPAAILGAMTLAALSLPGEAAAEAVTTTPGEPAPPPIPAVSPNGKPLPGAVVPQADTDEPVVCPKSAEEPPRHYDDCPGCGLG